MMFSGCLGVPSHVMGNDGFGDEFALKAPVPNQRIAKELCRIQKRLPRGVRSLQKVADKTNHAWRAVNVDPICGDICYSDFQWEAACTVAHLLEVIVSMLQMPDESPCLLPHEYDENDLPPEKEIIRMFHRDRLQYQRVACQWTELYAVGHRSLTAN
mmetsp:Transcript_40875/g.64855  ORF Transcript_40875/g.64855 Transcript_40875/m.64855 type:complete len:157 (+) Transcript_40875:64-534(+)